MSYQDVILQLLSGLSVGMVIFIITAGLSIVFGTLRVLNLAHGSFYMVGAYLALWMTSR